MDAVRKLLHKKIDYDILKQGLGIGEVELLEELIDVVVEVCVNMGDLKINGSLVPHYLVEQRMMSLDMTKIRYVMDSLKKTTKGVKNSLMYLITTLYNASLTVENHLTLEVQHDESCFEIECG